MSVRPLISRYLLALSLLAGCARLGDSPVELANNGRELVPVSLSLAIAPAEDGMPATKTDYEPDTWGDSGAAAAIKTLLILQFEWQDPSTPGTARLIHQQFISDGAPDKVKLVSSKVKNTIYIIANTSGRLALPLNLPLADFLESYNGNPISLIDDLTGSGIWYSPDGTAANRYLRMNACVVLADGVETGTALGATYLKRNCAKVVVNVKNTSPVNNRVIIDGVQLRDINRNYHYVTDVPAALSPLTFVDLYTARDSERINDAEQAFLYNDNPDQSQQYIFYIPLNERGSSAVTSQTGKNEQAPQGATYFRIYATCGGSPVNYTYYLGANLVTDYNLEPNKKYVYDININGKGNAMMDSRIEDMGDVTFTKDANCYMLKPPAARDGQTPTRTYKIPVRRAAVFWNQPYKDSEHPAVNMGVYGAADRDAYVLLESTLWKAFLVWNEVKDKNGSPVADSELLPGAQYDSGEDKYVVPGQGFNPATGANSFIKIKITAGMMGNALVAIKKVKNNSGIPDDTDNMSLDDILWSWHIWVTDYDPYVNRSPVPNTYVYTVPNGEIHRYADGTSKTLWTSGDYVNAFMMDRNVGALASAPETMNDDSPVLGCFYQFGRKDPFRTKVDPSYIAADMTDQPDADESTVTVKKNIRYSIHNPDLFINGGSNNWTAYESGLGTSAAAWVDPRKDQHDEDPSSATYDYCEPGKSIYDPCPYGWQIPVYGAWSDFSTNTVRWTTTPVKAVYYYPKGSAANGQIYYPKSGWRRSTRQDSGGGYGYYWTENVLNANNARSFRFYSSNGTDLSGAGINNSDYRSNGFVIRCVRLSHKLPY